ncbi:MAG: DUF1573 domain-containing protein [Flavobacterium sp.]|nr:DUF1573 domain-containing protein [Flavobacterium sp.]
MKSLKFGIVAVAFGLMSFTGVQNDNSPVEAYAKTTAVAWKAEMIDVGNIPQGTPKSIDFEFRNTGTTSVIITNVKAACGCTATEYTKTPVKPGETASVTAVYNAAAKGTFQKTVTVTTNADEAPTVLTFKGIVI